MSLTAAELMTTPIVTALRDRFPATD